MFEVSTLKKGVFMENFYFFTPTKIYFGKNEETKVGIIIKDLIVNKVLIVYGGGSIVKNGLLEKVKSLLDKEGIPHIEFGGITPNPELKKVREGIQFGIKNNVDFVLAIGGGSVLDAAKDISHGIANPDDDVWEYRTTSKKPAKTLKKGAILTLSAAGSEMSNSSVITNTDINKKSGFVSDLNRMDFSILNPELTYTVSKYQTGCGATDIAMHSIERYFALGEESGLTDDICLSIVKNAFKYGKQCYDNPTDYNARANMMWAGSLSHNGLTGCGRTFLLTVHQLEHALSGLYPEVAHGAGLAALWCSWARYVYKSNISRWVNYARKVWDIDPSLPDEEAILEGIKKQEEYYKSVSMPIGLKELNIKESDLEKLALLTTNNKNRVIPGYKNLAYEDVLEIFRMAFNR